jgi:hypothetical protein
MGAWQYVARIGTTRMMHRGYRHEGAGGSGREDEWTERRAKESQVDHLQREREAEPHIERRQPSITIFLRARCEVRPFNPDYRALLYNSLSLCRT